MGRPRGLKTPGEKFGRLTAVADVGGDKHQSRLWKFLCECGAEVIAIASEVRRGKKRSCGCLMREARYTHKKCGTNNYLRWKRLVQKCTNPRHPDYRNYGGRGIMVCKRWKRFENFLADMGEPPNGAYSINRINNNGPYSPKNCHWATPAEQMRNTRRNRFVTYKGKRQCAKAWAVELGISTSTLSNRVNTLGWTFKEAFETPIRKLSRKGANRERSK